MAVTFRGGYASRRLRFAAVTTHGGYTHRDAGLLLEHDERQEARVDRMGALQVARLRSEGDGGRWREMEMEGFGRPWKTMEALRTCAASFMARSISGNANPVMKPAVPCVGRCRETQGVHGAEMRAGGR